LSIIAKIGTTRKPAGKADSGDDPQHSQDS
jgi:hypothetical protein